VGCAAGWKCEGRVEEEGRWEMEGVRKQ
jgi:hypothetical protein